MAEVMADLDALRAKALDARKRKRALEASTDDLAFRTSQRARIDSESMARGDSMQTATDFEEGEISEESEDESEAVAAMIIAPGLRPPQKSAPLQAVQQDQGLSIVPPRWLTPTPPHASQESPSAQDDPQDRHREVSSLRGQSLPPPETERERRLELPTYDKPYHAKEAKQGIFHSLAHVRHSH